jgi:sugar/nucleoside kinase (ribokinase family)
LSLVRPLGVIGHLSLDAIGGAVPRIGGGPWHAARAFRVLGQGALLFAKCGDPELGRRLAARGLPCAVAVGGETTGFSFSYDERGVRTMLVDAVGDPWTIADLPQTLLRRVAWLQLAPLLTGDFDPDVLAWLARDRRLLFDGQGLVRARERGPLRLQAAADPDLLRHIAILKLASEEAAVIGDVGDLGVPEVLVTHGAAGADVVTREGTVRIAAREIDADPTGAGDAFSAAYLASRAQGHAPVSAARRASAVVAAVLTGGVR